MPKEPEPIPGGSALDNGDSFRQLVQNLRGYAVALLGADGRVASWNIGAEQLQGWKAEEMVGEHCSRWYPEEARQKGLPEEELSKATKEGGVEVRGWRVRKNGSRFWTTCTISALQSPRGELLGFGTITRETPRDQGEEQRFRDLVEGAPDAMVISNERGEIVLTNSQAEKLLGYAKAELLGLSIDQLVPERLRGKHPAQRESYRTHPGVRPMGAGLALYARHKDGHEIPVEIALSPLQTPEGLLVTSSIRDVSERRQAEETIRAQAQEILELSTPVMQLWQGIVLAPLIGSLDSHRTQQFTARLLSRIVESNSAVALIDITGVPTIDTGTAQHLMEAVSAVRLVGAQVVLTGVRPAIAQTLVHLGIQQSGMITRASLAAGLQWALASSQTRRTGDEPGQ